MTLVAVNTTFVWGAVLVSLLTAVPVAAALAPGVPGLGVSYAAPDGCLTRPEFLAAVAARGAVGLAPDGAGQLGGSDLVIDVRRDADGFSGSLFLRDGQIASGKRQVRGLSCAEVTDALAVVTAIALRSEGAPIGPSTPRPAAAPPPVSAPAAPAVQPAANPPLRLDSASEPHLVASTRAFPPRREDVPVRAGNLRFDLVRSATLFAGASTGLVRSVVMPRYDLTLPYAFFVTTPDGQQRIAGVVINVRLTAFGTSRFESADTRTTLSGFAFGLGICQSPHYDTRGLVLLFCAEYGGGFLDLQTKGLDGAQVQAKQAGMGVASLGSEIQYNFSRWFHLGARAGGEFNVGQFSAERGNGAKIFGSRLWSAYALVGLGFQY